MKFNDFNNLVQRWEQTGLLDNFVDKAPVALCLHSQIKLNEKLDLSPHFRRWSIPLLIRTFQESKAFNRNHFTNLFDNNSTQNIMFLKTGFSYQGGHDLETEAQMVADLAKSLQEELDTKFQDRKGATITFHGISHTPEGKLVLHYG